MLRPLQSMGRLPDPIGMNSMFCFLVLAQAAALDLGLPPVSGKGVESEKFLYLMGADDVNLDKISEDAFVVYQGHHRTVVCTVPMMRAVAPKLVHMDEREPAAIGPALSPEFTHKMSLAPFRSAFENSM
ncbi:hypothetical protein SLEP1_g12953 [Rubroshorea leprosula]|uniref:Molybdopterin oxidoreductase domain-containing protein n=1 Tax=Rubroshorea leprosula TaxID=152421 RepID=A0AAV5IIP1_9ROSI|nr:hypothetical protein SLEP1_g12953 [Rubroshorea leprosula]